MILQWQNKQTNKRTNTTTTNNDIHTDAQLADINIHTQFTNINIHAYWCCWWKVAVCESACHEMWQIHSPHSFINKIAKKLTTQHITNYWKTSNKCRVLNKGRASNIDWEFWQYVQMNIGSPVNSQSPLSVEVSDQCKLGTSWRLCAGDVGFHVMQVCHCNNVTKPPQKPERRTQRKKRDKETTKTTALAMTINVWSLIDAGVSREGGQINTGSWLNAGPPINTRMEWGAATELTVVGGISVFLSLLLFHSAIVFAKWTTKGFSFSDFSSRFFQHQLKLKLMDNNSILQLLQVNYVPVTNVFQL